MLTFLFKKYKIKDFANIRNIRLRTSEKPDFLETLKWAHQHSPLAFLCDACTIVAKVILVLKTTNLKLNRKACLNSGLCLVHGTRQAWKTIQSVYKPLGEIRVQMLHSQVSPLLVTGILLCKAMLTFYSALRLAQPMFSFSSVPEWLLGKAVFLCALQGHEPHAVHRVWCTGTGQHVGPVDHHAEHDRGGHLLRHVCGPRHGFNPVSGFVPTAVPREGNVFSL